MDNDEEVARLRETYLELKKRKKKTYFYLPNEFRFPLTWTIFFALIGIIVQSILAKTFVFTDFFGSNYIAWFKMFATLTSIYQVSGTYALAKALGISAYYFFFTGGLLSLVWAFIYWLTHIKIWSKKDDLGI